VNAGVRLSRGIIAHHSKSFALARHLLPARCRDDAAVVYAWCRRADDAVDELPPGESKNALERLQIELDDIYRGEGQPDPLLRAFQEVVERVGIPRSYPEDLLRGMRMDVDQARYDTLDDLLLYCYRVAGTVGLMMCHVMGVKHERALRHAAHLGIAMQLTNVCRDVLEDWQRRRVYLPRALLPELDDANPDASFPVRFEQAFARAVERLLLEADAFYASGDVGLQYLTLRCRWAVGSARLVYSRIGAVIRSRGCRPTLGRAYVPLREKLLLVLDSAITALRRAPARLPGRREQPRTLPPVRFPSDVFPV